MQGIEEGKLYVTTGKSRSGKTALTERLTRKAKRLIVWDPKGWWAREAKCERVDSCGALLRRIRNYSGALRIAFVSPNPSHFDYWAQCAFWWGRLAPCTAIAEEIANVTNAGKAPQGWHLLLSQGLEFGITIHALTQAISESDKTCVRNASIITAFKLAFENDEQYMSRCLRVPLEELQRLEPLAYVARETSTDRVERGRLKFAQNRAPDAQKEAETP